MKKIVCIRKNCGIASLLVFAILLSFFLEIFFFNFSYFSQKLKDYPRREIDLTAYEAYNGEALPLLPENATFSFDNLGLPARSVTVHTSGPVQMLSGNIGICDEASAYNTVGAGSFQVNPGGQESSFTVPLNSRGDLSRLRITFTEVPNTPVFLLSVVLNEQLPLQIHALRLLFLFGLFFVLLSVFRFRLYDREYCPEKPSHRLLNLGALVFCLFISCCILYGSRSDHAYLKPYPTQAEIRSSAWIVDAYMQQLDAFEKGQVELDLDINPKLEHLDNPYDKGERDSKQIIHHADRAYYNGKYYSYFGLAPLFTVYYPVYWMTGMLPTEALSSSLLAIFAIISIFAAIQGLLLLFKPRVNLLLFLVGEIAVVCGSFLYLLQSSLTFYYLPPLSAIGWMAAFIAFSSFACLSQTGAKRIILFALSGIAVVMLVLSRPNSLLLAIAFAAPLFLWVLFDKQRSLPQKLQSAVPFLIPVLIGGAAIMYYNYIRFDSPFEFGTSYQLTMNDIRYNKLTFHIEHVSSMLYHYFLEPFASIENFPFLTLAYDPCLNFGNYLYQTYSVGLFAMPLNLGVFLAGFTFRSKEKKDSLKKWMYGLLFSGVLLLAYLNFEVAGIHIRYVCDLSLIFSLVAFLLILEHIHFDQTKSARILYAIALCFCLITIGRGLLTIFSNETNFVSYFNPDFYLKIAKMF